MIYIYIGFNYRANEMKLGATYWFEIFYTNDIHIIWAEQYYTNIRSSFIFV